MVNTVLARQETGNYNKERAPSFENPGSGGGACNGEQILHTLHLEPFQGQPPAFSHHSISCLPASTQLQRPRHSDKSHTLEAKGIDKQGRLLRQRVPQVAVFKLQREALRRKDSAILFEEMWRDGVHPMIQA